MDPSERTPSSKEQLEEMLNEEIYILREMLSNMKEEEYAILTRDIHSIEMILEHRGELMEGLRFWTQKLLLEVKHYLVEDCHLHCEQEFENKNLSEILDFVDFNDILLDSLKSEMMTLIQRIDLENIQNDKLIVQILPQPAPQIPANPLIQSIATMTIPLDEEE